MCRNSNTKSRDNLPSREYAIDGGYVRCHVTHFNFTRIGFPLQRNTRYDSRFAKEPILYTVGVRRHVMIAHSLPDPYFGPAAGLHGATYVVDVEFRSEHLNAKSVVVDIGVANERVGQVLKSLDFRNLDDDPRFAGQFTTTEVLAAHIHKELAQEFGGEFQGELKVTLHESHVAWASYLDKVG
jgi:6-pyruvoyltetrahydropterin/6-carboxytetrahydropterin synthase